MARYAKYFDKDLYSKWHRKYDGIAMCDVDSVEICGNKETRNKRNVWTVTTKPFKGVHFATFPKDLIEPCIKAGCPEDGIVLDPFGGAGTTGIVASLNNRNSILIELNPEYIKLAKDRIEKELGLFNG